MPLNQPAAITVSPHVSAAALLTEPRALSGVAPVQDRALARVPSTSRAHTCVAISVADD